MMNYGIESQLKIYTKTNENYDLPISIEDWRRIAMETLNKNAWGYLEGAAGNEDTMNENRKAFLRYYIRPRYLRNVEGRDISIELFGKKFDTPFILAPIGVQSILHKDAEMATARAAANLKMPFVLSTVSSVSIEDIAKENKNSEKWFQIYPGRDKKIMKSMIERADNSGYSAIMVTVDTTMLGWREIDLKNAYLPFLEGEGIANYLTDPEFRSRLGKNPEDNIQDAIEEFLFVYVNPGFTWEDFSEIRKWTDLPLIIKGISSYMDVKKAFELKADAVVISNHGGRQVDGAIPSIDALNEITGNNKINGSILFDSGIRHAADAVKALALGAKAVLIGRPYAYALSVAGQRGVECYMNYLRSEMDLEMGLAGYSSIKELNRDCIYIK
ncbi:alpha-hydroxy-acid oxidizing protein [Acidiplasma cupricumulans]|nr:alpha-hydroxy-acid oxidizing protein [Acidiplasma cupricumulans]